jgi:hypothetical protein
LIENLEIVKVFQVLSLHPPRYVHNGENIHIRVDSFVSGSVVCVFGGILVPSIRSSDHLLVCSVPPNVHGNATLSFKHFDHRLPQEFALNIIDDVRILSYTPRMHLSGSKFELRMQLSGECTSCVATCSSSCILEDLFASSNFLIMNVIGSTGYLTVSLFNGLRAIDNVTIQLVSWPEIDMSDSIVHVFAGIEGFVPFQGHFSGIPVSCHFGDLKVDPTFSSSKLICPFNFSSIGTHSFTLSIQNVSRSKTYAVFVVHRHPGQISGSVFNSMFIVGGFEIPANLSWTCKFGIWSEVHANEVNGKLLCPIPISVNPSSQVRIFASMLQEVVVGNLISDWSSQISFMGPEQVVYDGGTSIFFASSYELGCSFDGKVFSYSNSTCVSPAVSPEQEIVSFHLVFDGHLVFHRSLRVVGKVTVHSMLPSIIISMQLSVITITGQNLQSIDNVKIGNVVGDILQQSKTIIIFRISIYIGTFNVSYQKTLNVVQFLLLMN